MDAAYTTTFRKTALLLTIALLLAAPFAAQAQPQFASGLTTTVNGTGCGQVTVTGTGDGQGNFINFSAAQAARQAGQPTMSVSPSSGTTPQQITICLANTSGVTSSNSQNITINLTSSQTGVTASTITVTWNPNGGNPGGGGGGSTGSGMTATLPSNPLQMSSYGGSQGQVSFTLNNTTASFLAFTATATYTSGSNWLTFPGSGTVSGLGTASITVYGNPNVLANATYNASLTFSYSGSFGSGTITIPVQFTVGSNTSSNGNLTFTPSPVTLNYASGSTTAPSQQVSLVTSASTFNATATSTGNWLLIGGQSATFGAPVANGMYVSTVSPTSGNFPSANASGTIQVTDSAGNSAYLTVNLVYNGGSNNGLTISPSPVSFSAPVGGSTAQQTVTVTSNIATSNLSITSTTGTGISATLSTNSATAGAGVTMTIYGNPAGLSANTYSGSVTVSNGSVNTTVYVTFTVGTGNPATSGSVAPTSLQFSYELGQPASGSSSSLVAQNIYDSVTGAYTTSVTSGNSWLSVPASGTGPAPIAVSISNPPTAAGSYTGSFNVQTVAGTQSISVSLLVSSNPVIFANPGIVYIPYTVNGNNPNYSFLVYSSDSSSVSISGTSGQSWLTAQQFGSTTPATFLLTVNGTNLSNGLNIANVTISSSAANSVLTVPVVVNVSGSTSTGSALTFSSSALTFTAAVGGASQSQNLNVTASVSTSYTLSASGVSNGITWLSVSPAGNLNTGTTASVSVTASPTGLAAGTYNGSLTFTTSSGTQTVNVTMNVGGSSTGSVSVSPTTPLSFAYTSGGTVPAAQTFDVLNSNPTAGSVNFTVGVTMANGTGWLSASPTSGTVGSTGIPISVSVSPASLAAGTYTGTVSVSPGGASIQVTLAVTGLPAISASPTSISLNYQAGSATIPSSTIQVTGSAASLSFTATASTTSGGNWLSVSPQSGNTGTSGTALTVTTSPSSLSAGTYNGTIVVAGTGGATGSTTVNVTLAVTAPLPTISALVNAASGASGAVSPGEIVSLFAPAGNPIGPGTPAYLTLDSTGANVLTTLGGVQVLFSGIPAPLLYVSATQINCVVPYGIAGLFAPFVQVKYLGQSSNSFNLTSVATAPGMFTQSSSGTGPGAILNADNSVNGPSHPAAKGTTIQIFMTGEGATNPPGVTGSVTCAKGCSSISQIPVPLLPVAITFVDSSGNHYGANYTFAGSAPGDVAGVFQVNAVVPTTVPSGTLQIYVTVGSNSSQSGVTVQVQ